MGQGHLDPPSSYFENRTYLITLCANELGIVFWLLFLEEDDETVGGFEHLFFYLKKPGELSEAEKNYLRTAPHFSSCLLISTINSGSHSNQYYGICGKLLILSLIEKQNYWTLINYRLLCKSREWE